MYFLVSTIEKMLCSKKKMLSSLILLLLFFRVWNNTGNQAQSQGTNKLYDILAYFMPS